MSPENRVILLLSTESTSNQKLMLEYEKHQELQLKSQRMQEDYERHLQAMEDSKGRALEDLTLFYESKLQEKMLMLGQVSGGLEGREWGGSIMNRQLKVLLRGCSRRLLFHKA